MLLLMGSAGTSLLLVLGEIAALALMASAVVRAIGICIAADPGPPSEFGRANTANRPVYESLTDQVPSYGSEDSHAIVAATDISIREMMVFVPLLISLVGLNMAPRLILDSIDPCINRWFPAVEQARVD
jgi:hypothetical protein